MKDCPFIPREITEYESELGPKLLLIAEKPLSTDKKEIFDSMQARSYLNEIFKSKFKPLETHISYINPNPAKYDFARGMFFNILGVAFVGQEAFEAFKKEYLSMPDGNGSYLYINEQKKVIRVNFTLLHDYIVKKYGSEEKNNDPIIPYVILPKVGEEMDSIKETLDNVSFVNDLPDSPYCDTNQLITKLEYLLGAYKEEAIKYFIFNGKINGNKIEYFSVYDEYTDNSVQYCPHDEKCKNDSPELTAKWKKLLCEVLLTIPVAGENAQSLVNMF